MISQYKLLSVYDTPQQLEFIINKLFSEGWELYGSPVVATSGTKERSTVYSQAMVKFELNPSNIPNIVEEDQALPNNRKLL